MLLWMVHLQELLQMFLPFAILARFTDVFVNITGLFIIGPKTKTHP